MALFIMGESVVSTGRSIWKGERTEYVWRTETISRLPEIKDEMWSWRDEPGPYRGNCIGNIKEFHHYPEMVLKDYKWGVTWEDVHFRHMAGWGMTRYPLHSRVRHTRSRRSSCMTESRVPCIDGRWNQVQKQTL